MKNLLLAIGAVALLGAAVVVLLVVALQGFAPDGVHVVVNDRELHWEDLSHWEAMGAGLGTLLAIGAAVIVVPIVLLLGVLLPLLLAAGALLLVVGLALGVGVLGMAPLLLPLLLLIWLWRRSQRRAMQARRAAQAASAPASKTTIDL